MRTERHRIAERKYKKSPKGRAADKIHHKKYRLKNLDKVREKSRAYYALNKERLRQYQKQYRQTEKSKLKEIARSKSPSRIAWVRNWKNSEKGKNTINRHSVIRRAITKIVLALTDSQWNEILSAFNHRCAYCGKSNIRLTQDHYVPVAKGGHHIKENVVPACQSCNSRKKDRHPHRLF